MIRILLFLVSISSAVVRTPQDLIDLVGRKGEITHLYDLYIRTGVPSTDTISGIIFSPTLSNPYGVDGLRLQPHLKGHNPYASMLLVYPPILDSGASVDHLAAVDVMDVVGADTSMFAILTRKGRVLIGDTLSATRLLQQGGGEQIHASLIRKSRLIAADTDHVLVGFPDTTRLRDTLPLLSSAIGQDYWFVLYHLSTADSGWVLYPHSGDNIEGYDSIILCSNLGRGWIHLLGLGDRWRVLGHHEEGTFQVTMGGVSGTVRTNGLYSIDNMRDVKIRVQPISGTSNDSSISYDLTGLNSRFTDPALDTTWTSESSAMGLDSARAVLQHCVLYGSGSKITCYRSDLQRFKASGIKSLLYGLNFQLRLLNPAPHTL